MLKSLQVKIAAGIAAAVVAVGGVTAAVVLTNQDAAGTSAEGQEGNTPNAADAGYAENTLGLAAQQTEEPTEAPHEHAYKEEITVKATCETDGLKTLTCECGDSYTEAIKATGHVFDYVYNEDATYEADGTETATCKNCDVTDTRTAEGTMLTYTYTDMSATMYAQSSVNVRDLPSTDGEKLGALSTNQEVAVSGQCIETGWYRFEYDGQTAYVSNNYLSDSKVEVAQSSAGGGSSSGLPAGVIDIKAYPTEQWIDMGSWFFYIVNSTNMPVQNDMSFWGDTKAILQERYPDKVISVGRGYPFKDWGISMMIAYTRDIDDPSFAANSVYYNLLSTRQYNN